MHLNLNLPFKSVTLCGHVDTIQVNQTYEVMHIQPTYSSPLMEG